MNHRISTIVLLVLLAIGVIAIVAANVDIWQDGVVADTATLINTTQNVCIGTSCWTGWQVSIENNASIAGSPICTRDNGMCANGTGTPSGGDGVVIETAECDGTCTTITEGTYG